MRALLTIIFSLLYLLSNTSGKGGGGSVPQYSEDPQSTALKNQLYGQISGIVGTPYDTLVQRFSPSADTQGLIDQSVNNYKGLLDTTDYSTTDFSKTQDAYLNTILGKYNDQRSQDQKALQESLIANNLNGSGPGYGLLDKFSKETATGAADVASTWAYNNIQTNLQQQSYKDALQRGDYTTMYNLALGKANAEIAPQVQATQTQTNNAAAGSGLLQQLNAQDMAKYQAALSAYQAQQTANKENGGNLGGLGTALGMGAGALLALPTGGLSVLAGAAIGGGVGGGLGSMLKY